jgi:nitrogen fixation NifU-like protein
VYSPQLIEHFEHPRNVGELPDADARAQVENPACGDIMLLTLKLSDGRIAEARYRTRGCVASIACGSLLTEWLRSKTPAEARALRREEVVAAIGGLSNESLHASHLVMDALNAALKLLPTLPRPQE